MASRFDDITVTGKLKCPEDAISAQTRSSILKQESGAIFPLGLVTARVWDAMQTLLPATAAADDLGLVGGTFGTAPPVINAGDCKALGATTRYARIEVPVPECYVAGQPFALSLSAGMKTTIASVSCTVDVEAYRLDKDSGISADLCTTAATTINSLVFADKSFVINPATLTPGDMLDVRIAIAVNDGATATAVTPTIAAIDRVCSIRG